MKRQIARSVCAIALLAMAGTIVASAQYSRPEERAEKSAAGATLTTEFVKTGLYVISGGGGNTLLRLTGNGLILVDGKLPGNYDLLRKRV